jgi:hypothetical protein
MTWTWRYLDAAGAVVADLPIQAFPAQSDAETWIGEEWQALLVAGVDSVVLLDGDREVYGPMGLRPE